MTPYTGGTVHSRRAALGLNMHGGGGFEVWQYTSRTPQAPVRPPQLGDHGVLAPRLKSGDVQRAFAELEASGATLVSRPQADPAGSMHFFVQDPLGNVFQIIEAASWFSGRRAPVGGVEGVAIGTPDIAKSLPLYQQVLGYDHIVYDETGVFGDFGGLPSGNTRVRRVLLTHSRRRRGGFAPLLGDTSIELIQSIDEPGQAVYSGRYWGDLGFIHVCFDVQGMDELKRACEEIGCPFTVDSGKTFDMGSAGGRFAYVEDAAGTLVEFVETHKLPILPALGINVDLSKGGVGKEVPKWVIRLLGLKRTHTL